MTEQPDPYAQLRPPVPPPAGTPQQAEQAVQQVQASATGDAGESLGQMSDVRGPLLPAEALMNQIMEQQRQFAEQLAGMQVQLVKAQQQAQAARALAGPPAIATYAKGIAAKLAGHRDANPDIPAGHFDDVIAHATELADHAAAAGDGNLSGLDRLEGLAAKVGRFLQHGHQARSGKHLDMSAVLSELNTVLDEADRLQAEAHSGSGGQGAGELVKAG